MFNVTGEGLHGIGRPRNQGILSMTPETGTSSELFFVQNKANLDESRREWTKKLFRSGQNVDIKNYTNDSRCCIYSIWI